MRVSSWMKLAYVATLATALPATYNPDVAESDNQHNANTTITPIAGDDTPDKDSIMIPVTQIYCTGHDMEARDVNRARRKVARWAKHHPLVTKRVKMGLVNDTIWYVCNCKWWTVEYLKWYELVQAQNLIYGTCGEHRSGGLWSDPWQKMYHIEPYHTTFNMSHVYDLCPHRCVVSLEEWGELPRPNEKGIWLGHDDDDEDDDRDY
ncbi:hypothetical protein M426DRAFT_12288 [Hypoxylon sp. CI-4A]|nr:hypothetical protein M426DRAFT_12288 [Hypoxylon sp. CI-4A]